MRRIFSESSLLRPALTVASLALGGVAAHAIDPDRILVQNVGDFSIKPQFGQSTIYTDNVFYGNDSIFLSGGGVTNVPIRPQEDDLILTASPGIKLQYGSQTANLVTFEYTLDNVFYTGHSDNDTRQHRLDLESRFQFGKFELTGKDTVDFLSSPLGGGAYTDPNQATRRDFILDRRQISLEHKLLFDYSEKTDAYGEFEYKETDFEQTTTLFDINNLRGSLGGTYKYSENLGFFTEGFYGQTGVSPNSNSTPGAWSQVYGGFVGVRGELTPKIKGQAKFGYEQREFPSADVSNSSPAFEISFDYAVGPKTTLGLSYSRRTSSSVQFANQTYVYDSVGLTVNQFIGSSGKWMAFGNVRYDDATFDQLPPENEISPQTRAIYPERSDMNLSFGLGVLFQPRPWCAFTLGYEFEHFDTDAVFYAAGQDLNGNLIVDRNNPRQYLVDYDNHRIYLKISIGY